MTLGYAPFGIWPVVPCALTMLFILLRHSTNKQTFKLIYCFCFAWFAAGISWVHVSIADFGGLPLFASVALMALLCSYLALYPTLAFYLLKKRFSPPLWPLAIGLLWMLTEWLRSWMLTGFPWLSVGYSQINSPLAGWIPILGETGTSVLLLMFCASLAQAITAKQWQNGSIMTLVLFVSGALLQQYSWVTPHASPINMAMVQGNIKQALRWTPEQDEPTMQKYRHMSEQLWAENQLVIWPEAAVPQLEAIAAGSGYLNAMDNIAAQHNSALISGIVNYNFESRQAYNNIIVLGKKRRDDRQGHYQYMHSNRYAKHHLLPIGEFIPFEDWLRGIAPLFDLPMSSFNRGSYQQENLLANGISLAPALCFEIAFPRQIRANLQPDTDMILTLSNDAWFGHSHGPAQHLEIAQVRALEFAIPVLRTTNNGITAFIDHKGQIQSRLPQFTAAVLSDKVQAVRGNTPYRLLGDLLPWLLSALAFTIALIKNRRYQQH